MEFGDQKRFFLDSVVQNGYTKLSELPLSLLNGLPEHLPKKWMNNFYKSMKFTSLPYSHRLVNRFMVGADPEFSLLDLDGQAVQDLGEMGLHVGPAFGADLCGRIAELRPAPSRFVLDVVASILAELRWMALTNTSLRRHSWVSKPFVGRDGVGGHVHFGRKRGRIQDIGDGHFRPNGQAEIEMKGLDKLFHLLTESGVFSAADVRERARATKYGRPGDVRPQRHGYEYRSMPSWIESPWMAYLTMVLAKLTVYNPSLVQGVKPGVTGKKFIRNLLALYKGMDDDALIAYNTLEVLGFPLQTGMDFKAAWGLNYPRAIVTDVTVIPEVIYPTDQDREAIFEHFRSGRPIPTIVPEANWSPTAIPKGYSLLTSFNATIQRKGVGELISGLVCSESRPVFVNLEGGNALRFVSPEQKHPTQAEINQLFASKPCLISKTGNYEIRIGEGIRESNQEIATLKKLILQKFPVWKVSEVKAESWDEFIKNSVGVQKPNLKGQVVI